MTIKPKIGFYWCASCGGCEEAVVDFAEDTLRVLEAVDIVLWPCAMDFKKADLEGMADQSIVATLLNGAIRTSEQEEMAHLLRRKSQYLIAFGACAQLGGIPGLANQFSREEILRYVFEEAPTTENETKTRPVPHSDHDGHSLSLPTIRNVVRSLDQVVEVDYYIPGCPPTPKITKAAIAALLEGNLPPKGSVLAPDIALCDQCPRKGTKPPDLSFTEFKRPHLTRLDPDTCFLAQGVVCLGPATRSGCEAACTTGGMPCSGCFGPTSRARDQGAKILSCLSANLAAKEEKQISDTLAGIPDPVGTFYRYGLAKSLLRRKVEPPAHPVI
ncbi:MAG TPA: oxidoreductase [Verrucomicrobiae bacterium]|nr:oxidoreductase [Verrucomicrobiae bacterium]